MYLDVMYIKKSIHFFVWDFREFTEHTNSEKQPMKESVRMLFLSVWDCWGKPVCFFFKKEELCKDLDKKHFFCCSSFIFAYICFTLFNIYIYFSCAFTCSPGPHLVILIWLTCIVINLPNIYWDYQTFYCDIIFLVKV